MRTYPKKYTNEEFLKFLEKNNVNDEIINKFVKLPETVERSGDKFQLDINSTWYNKGNTYYEFELNYYSDNLVEYLFSSKVFTDVEISINYLQCELVAKNLI